MKPSRRISSLKPSPTLALNAKATALAKEGVNVFNFAVGEPDFPSPAPIVDAAIASLKEGKTKYGQAGGGPMLRQAIAAKLERENELVFDPAEIVAGTGAKEILFHLFLALLNDGDEVLVPAPYWVSYADQIAAAGAKAVIIPMQGGEPNLSPGVLERYATDRTVGIVLNSPNNPAGYVWSESQLRAIGNALIGRDWWIISDEIYEYLAFDCPHVSLLKLFPELKERFFLINGLSKGFAMTGWRVGYGAGPKALMALVKSLQSHSSTCIPPFIEEAATFALQKGRALVEPEIALLKRRRDLALATLRQALPEVGFLGPQGAFYIFLDVRSVLARASRFQGDTLKLSEWLLSDYHVALVPGEAFGVPGYLRLSYATSDAIIRGGIARLKEAFASLP